LNPIGQLRAYLNKNNKKILDNVVYFRGIRECKIHAHCLICGKLRLDDARVREWSNPDLKLADFLKSYQPTPDSKQSIQRYINAGICNDQYCQEQLYAKTGGFNNVNLTWQFPTMEVEAYVASCLKS
jgi:hypothetical protein